MESPVDELFIALKWLTVYSASKVISQHQITEVHFPSRYLELVDIFCGLNSSNLLSNAL
ncbi:hypothetical protein I79_022812 [Cricetulus griseus]|uniref:Uncharacterized protein n=1 Tax=Cricetulus griseus TaxID=10029 RepID=G3IGC8_CRIGR|nr:hypothetical protein I79_022812 [Cricetulus griseus]